MRSSTLLSALAVAAPAVLAQNATSNSTSLCDKYAMAVFNASNATTQYTLLTVLVNTAVIGNYSKDPKNAVTGILNNGTYEGRPVSLLKYFDGMLASSNRGGSEGVAVNSLDGGGAEPLMMNKPANGTSSNQYFLLTHLYSYFGALLGCSAYSKEGFPAYTGFGSQYEVHKFMDLSHDEVSYFIQEVGLAATSLGVTTEDATAVGKQLDMVFNYKCAANATVIPAQGPQQQSICIADDCPTAPNATCSAYKAQVAEPVPANDTNMYTSTRSAAPSGTAAGGSGSSASGTDSGSTAESTGAATMNVLGAVVMGAAGIAALAAGL